MSKPITIVHPIARPREEKIARLQADINAMGRTDIVISTAWLDNAPLAIESNIDEVLCGPDLLKKAREAEQSGAAAIVIDCLGDPALDAVREAVTIPVVGPGETAFHLACTLGHKFAVVTVMERLRPLIENHALKYGIQNKLAAVKAVEVSVLDIEDALFEAIADKAIEAIKENGADTIVLGCTGFLGLERTVTERIKDSIGVTVPVINPLPVAVMAAANLIDLQLRHSALAYPGWPEKAVKGFDFIKDNAE